MEEITKSLSRYPSSFDVAETIATISREEMVKIKQKLEIEMESSEKEFSTDIEKLRVENLLSFLCFNLGDREMAVAVNKSILDREADNMVALSNKAWFSVRDRKNMLSCQEICERLKLLGKKNKLACLIARAEIAFTYSRLGLRHYQKASSEFENVLQDCKKINEETKTGSSYLGINTRDHVPIEYVCVWMYGKALCQQRLTNLYHMYDLPEIEKQKNNCSRTLDLLIDIITLEDSESECIKRYKARSYIEVGLIAYNINRNKSVFPFGMKEVMPLDSPFLMQTTEYFIRALEHYPDDVFVLERSGKYFRYINDVEQSIRLLIKAIRIKPTSFGYHHLALSFIRLLEFDKGILAQRLIVIPLNRKEETEKQTETNTFMQTNNTYQHKTETRSRENATFTSLHNDTYFAERIPTKQKKQSYRGHYRVNQRRYPGVRSAYQNGNRHIDRDTENMSQNQVFIKQTEKVERLATSDTTIQSRNTERHGMRKSYDTAVDKLTETFSQVNVSYRKDNTVNVKGSVDGLDTGKFQGRRGHIPMRRFSVDFDRGRRLERRPYNRGNYRNFRQKDADFFSHHSKLKSKPGIKCPKNPVTINYNDNKTVVDITIEYLDKASEMSSNTVAIYDKAILYRQTNRAKTALEVLEHLMQNKEEFSTKCMLANIYEQSAYCISDILRKPDHYNMDGGKEMEADRIFYLKSSVEISCSLIDKIPGINNIWKSAVTLRSILFDKLKVERTKKTLKELWSLYKKLDDHSDAIEVLKELQTLVEDEDEEKEIIEGIVQHHLALDNFEEAIIALRMSTQLENGQTFIQKELLIKVFIEAGLDAFKRKHYEKGKMRIREAFKFVEEYKPSFENSNSTNEANRDTEYEVFDLFILSNLDDEENGRKLMIILNNLGLKTTFNIDSPAITPGTPEVNGMTDMMYKSNAFVVVVDFDINDKKMQHIIARMQSIYEDRRQKTLMFVVTLPDSTEIPPGSVYSTFKMIDIDLKSLPEDQDSPNGYCFPEGVKNLLMFLASV